MSEGRDEVGVDHMAARDLRTLVYSHKALRNGYLALLPYVGLAFGPMAFTAYIRSRLESGMTDNPGGWHALAGAILGVIGFLASGGWFVVTLFD